MKSFKRHLMAMGSVMALMTGAAPAFAYNNKAYISQPGNDNNASQDQQGSNNSASVTQSGDNGTSVQTQAAYSSFNTETGMQSGPGPNYLSQTQSGNGNSASVTQYNPGFSSPNVAVQTQAVAITGYDQPVGWI